MSNITEIQRFLNEKADLQAQINISAFDGSIEIKTVNNQKYIYVRKRYYEVLSLCENHDWENAYTPFDNIETFINNYENRIYSRGKRIIEKLREQK